MDTQGVHILHITHGDTVIMCITHNFIFYFFIVMEVLFNQDLRSKGQRTIHNPLQFFLIMGNARTLTAKRKACANHDWKANLMTDLEGLF